MRFKISKNLKCNSHYFKVQKLHHKYWFNIWKTDPTTTQEVIAKKIKKSLRTVKSYMSEMQNKGLIERTVRKMVNGM